jgi:monofunctional biosynthetic peptidoglycan transglycosylase
MVTAAAGALIAVFWVSLPSAAPLRRQNPPTTAIMEARDREARAKGETPHRTQHWVPLARISPWLQRAVVNSEDARFYEHDGVDVKETEIALASAMEKGELGRGASTLTQQLAKNLWLGENRSLWRKLREYFLARRLEELGKPRILELYLNVVEFGPGIYGAEAASRTYFHKPAAELLPEEAALMTALLPAPRKRNPYRPSEKLRKRAFDVLALYSVYGQLPDDAVVRARGRLVALIGDR